MRARQGMSLHWDGLSATLHEVVLSSALGDGATRRSIQLQNLARIEQWMLDVQARVYRYRCRSRRSPADGLRGYDRPCARCDAPGGERTGTVVPVGKVGTDGTDSTCGPRVPDELQHIYRRLRLGLHGVPQDQRIRCRPARRHLAPCPGPPQRFGPFASGTVRAATRRAVRVLSRLRRVTNPARVGSVSEGEAERDRQPLRHHLPAKATVPPLRRRALAAQRRRAHVRFLKLLVAQAVHSEKRVATPPQVTDNQEVLSSSDEQLTVRLMRLGQATQALIA